MHSSRYTFTFTVVITIIASTLLALASTLLEERQDYNIDVDKKKNILKCVGINVDEMSSEMIVEEYSRNIENLIISYDGKVDDSILLDDLIISETKSTGQQFYNYNEKEYLPVYISSNPSSIIIPISGKGLWSTLYGYIALEKDYNTVKGITFYQHGETPGLGGEVDKKWFQENFIGKKIYDLNDKFVSIEVVKGKVLDVYSGEKINHAVDGISGATITSKGVSDFIKNDLKRYDEYFAENKID